MPFWRNVAVLASGEVGARALQAAAWIWLTRVLGPETVGVYGIAVAIATIAGLFVQQGFDALAVKAAARDESHLPAWHHGVLRARLMGSVVGAAIPLAAMMLPALNGAGVLLWTVYAATAVRNLTPRWILQARGQTQRFATATALPSLVFLVCALFLVRSPAGVLVAALAQLAGECAAFVLVAREWPVARGEAFGALELVRSALPVTLSLFIGHLLFNVDLLVLAVLRPPAEAGYYSAAYRITAAMSMGITALQTAILPELARMWPDRVRLLPYARRIAVQASAAGLGAAVVLALLAPLFIRLLYGAQLAPAAPLLAWLGFTLPLQVLRGIGRQVCFSASALQWDLRVISAGLLANIAVDVTLVPFYGPLACAWGTLAAECAMLMILAAALRRL